MKKLLISLLAAIVSLIGLQTSHAEEYFFDEISGMDVRKEMVSVDTDFQIHNPSMTYPICKIKAGTEVWVPRNQLYSGSGRLIVKGTLAQPCHLTVIASRNPLTIEQRQLPANATFYIKGGDAAGGGVIKLELGEYTSASDNSPRPIPCNPDTRSPFAEDTCVNINKPGPIATPIMDDAKASMPEKIKGTVNSRTWTRVAYTEAQFLARGFTWGNNDPPALVQVPLSQSGLIWVIFYSNPQNSAAAKNTLGGFDWSPIGHTIWGFRRPDSGQAGYGRSEGIYTFILKPHSNLKGFEAGIHVTLNGKGAVGGDQLAGFHTLEILFSPD